MTDDVERSEGQFFFGVSVRAAMRLSGSHRKADSDGIGKCGNS